MLKRRFILAIIKRRGIFIIWKFPSKYVLYIYITSITRRDEKLFNLLMETPEANIKDQGAFSNAVMFNLFYIQ